MKLRSRATSFVSTAAVFCAAPFGVVQAQSPEPGVDTSAPRLVAAPAAPASTAMPASRAAPAPGTPAPAAVAAPRRPANRVMDRLDLEASQITGNRELPRVLYIVPWRAPRSGELEGRPVNSLLYELTKPVDRDVFRRENRYYDALAAAPAAGGSGPEPGDNTSSDSPDPAPAGTPVRDTSQPRSPSGN